MCPALSITLPGLELSQVSQPGPSEPWHLPELGGGEAVLLPGRASEVPLVAKLAQGLQECILTSQGWLCTPRSQREAAAEGRQCVQRVILRPASHDEWPVLA